MGNENEPHMKDWNERWPGHSRAMRPAVVLAIILFSIFSLSAQRSLADDSEGKFRKGEVLVEIKPGASIEAINARYGTSTIQCIYGTNLYRLATPRKKKENKFRKRLANDPDVLIAALNPVITTPVNVFGRAVIGFPGDDPTPGQVRADYVAQQLVGDLFAIQLRAKGAGVIVAVVDTGIDRNHPDIKDHIWSNPNEIPGDNIDNDNDGLVDDVFGWNFFDNTPDTMEQRGGLQTSIAGHGTFIAGLIALIAPQAKIMPIRAFSSDGVSDAFSVAQAIKYAGDHGARVINLSFGSTEESQVMHDAVTYARQRGVLLVAAVGNENKANDQSPQFPANWSQEVMSIAALDRNNRKATFSNFGTDVSVSAPGVDLVSLFPEINNTPDYAMWSGTSFAAPLAAAEAALIFEDNPKHSDVRSTIETTATNVDDVNPGFAGKLGKGRIDPLEALKSLTSMMRNNAEITLSSSEVEPAARGAASVSIAGMDEQFEIEAEELRPRTAYKIVVDGNIILDGMLNDAANAKAVTSSFGNLQIRFATTPGTDRLPLPRMLHPVNRITRVEVRDAQDHIVLANSFGAPQPGMMGQSVEKEAGLSSTGVIPGARGRTRAGVGVDGESLRIDAEGLATGAAYEVVADGMSLGSVIAQSGSLRIVFTSNGSSGRALPPQLRPVTKIQQIEVHNSLGQTVLQGTFQPGGDDFGGGDNRSPGDGIR